MESRAGKTITPVTEEQEGIISEQKFWIAVNKAEAHFGLGEMMEYEQSAAAAALVKHDDWMMESFTKQLQKLSEIVNKQEAFA